MLLISRMDVAVHHQIFVPFTKTVIGYLNGSQSAKLKKPLIDSPVAEPPVKLIVKTRHRNQGCHSRNELKIGLSLSIENPMNPWKRSKEGEDQQQPSVSTWLHQHCTRKDVLQPSERCYTEFL